MIKSFRDLRVWQLGMDLAVEAYHMTKVFPKYEAYGLGAQIQRAAVSIPSNIAEGHAREHRKEYLHHLSTARPPWRKWRPRQSLPLALDIARANSWSLSWNGQTHWGSNSVPCGPR